MEKVGDIVIPSPATITEPERKAVGAESPRVPTNGNLRLRDGPGSCVLQDSALHFTIRAGHAGTLAAGCLKNVPLRPIPAAFVRGLPLIRPERPAAKARGPEAGALVGLLGTHADLLDTPWACP